MLTAFLKLLDVAARSLFVLLVLFSLPARESGQFGLLLILIALFALFAGYERYVDLQRRLAKADRVSADQLVLSSVRLYALSYLALSPLLVASLILWAQLPWTLATMGVLVATGEHLSNEAYRAAAVVPRYRQLLIVALVKNLILVCAGASSWWADGMSLTLGAVLQLWSTLSAGVLIVLCLVFFQLSAGSSGPGISLARQLRASRTHFVVGLVALLSLQADRLIAGFYLSLETSGVYFRHVFLASVVYQTLGILSFNRIMPGVYECLSRQKFGAGRAIIARERRKILPIYLSLALAATSLEILDLHHWRVLDRVTPLYLAVLILTYLIRNLADYNSLFLNGIYRERDVLRSQMLGFVISILTSLWLTPMFGIPGLLLSALAGAIVYLVASKLFSKRAYAVDVSR